MPHSVLFLCGMNVIRSPMAEQLAREILPPGVYIASAGVRSGERDPFVDVVMQETGLSLGNHQPRTMDELDDTGFDLVITLTPEAHHQAMELTRHLSLEVEYWPTDDPTAVTGSREQRLDAYRAVRNALKKRLIERFSRS
ncbi:low molecular weight phosphatase family protein [Limoniibacter endophyticus]|nr:low molecular weight phosphatase family protein [Limoniibacter endophyticus]